MSSNINPSINTPPMTPWEEAPQLISNDAQIGLIPPPSLSSKTGPTKSGIFFLIASFASSIPHLPSSLPLIFILPLFPHQHPFPKTDSYQPNSNWLVSLEAPFSTTLILLWSLSYQSVLQVPLAVLLGNSLGRIHSLTHHCFFFISNRTLFGSIVSCNHKCISLRDCIIQRLLNASSLWQWLGSQCSRLAHHRTQISSKHPLPRHPSHFALQEFPRIVYIPHRINSHTL